MKAIEFYQFSSVLFEQNLETEVTYRTVINRAYYSAFLSARDVAKITYSSCSVHYEVIAHFGIRLYRKIFNQLQQLKSCAKCRIIRLMWYFQNMTQQSL